MTETPELPRRCRTCAHWKVRLDSLGRRILCWDPAYPCALRIGKALPEGESHLTRSRDGKTCPDWAPWR